MSGRKTITYINFLQGIPAPIVALGGMIKVFLFYPLSVRHPTKKFNQKLNRNSTYPKTLCAYSTHTHNKNKTRQPWGRPPRPLLPPMALCLRRNVGATTPYESSTGVRTRVRVHCGKFLCLGHQNGTHQKLGRWAEHRS